VAGGSHALVCVLFVSLGEFFMVRGSILGLSKFQRESSFKCEVEVGVRKHNQQTRSCMMLYFAGRQYEQGHEPEH
jgi:hypothetical protein